MASDQDVLPSGGSGLTALSFRHLNRVRLVAEFGSVSRVASYLKRSQTTITKSIREIELALGVDLFERTTRGLRMTQAGSIMRQRLTLAYDEFCEAREDFIAHHGDVSRPGLNAIFSMDVSNSRLKTLVTLCNARNISRAASMAGVTVDAMYKTLHELEDQLGVILFERRPGADLVPTEFGLSFAEHVRRASGEIEAAVAEITALSGRLGGRVMIGTMPRARQLLMPRTIAALMESSPDIQVVTQDGTYIWLEPALRSTMVDLIVGALHDPLPETGLLGEVLLVDRLILVTGPNHPLLKMKSLDPGKLADFPWMLPSASSPQRRMVNAFLEENGLESPQRLVETASFSTVKALLADRDFIAVSSVMESTVELRAGSIRRLDVKLSPRNQLFRSYLLSRVHAIPTPAASAFRDMLMTQARLLAEELDLPAPDSRDRNIQG